jgi:hypothetical protein
LYPDGKYVFWQIQCPAAVSGILIFGSCPPYSLDLNLLVFSISRVLQAKVQATPHSNLAALFPSIAAECDQLAVILYISAKHAAHSAAAMKPPLRKIKFELNKWLANSTAHTKQYFSGLQKLQ